MTKLSSSGTLLCFLSIYKYLIKIGRRLIKLRDRTVFKHEKPGFFSKFDYSCIFDRNFTAAWIKLKKLAL